MSNTPTFGKYLPESEEKKEQYKKQLKMGIRIEEEHYDLYEFLKDKVDNFEDIISEKEFYAKIAKAHLRENSAYYDVLEEAGLWWYVKKKEEAGKMLAAELKLRISDYVGSDKVKESYVIRSMDKIQRKLLEEFWMEVVNKRYLNKTYEELPIENMEQDYLNFVSKKIMS